MWTKLLLALVCQFDVTWSQHLQLSDLGRSTNVYNPFKFNDYNIRVTWNELVNNQVWLSSLTKVFKKNFQTSYDSTPRITWNINICEDLEKLIEVYFRDIKVDRVPDDWRLLSSFWSQNGTAERFGISEQFATNGYSYVLIKTSVIQNEAAIISPLARLNFKRKIQKVLDQTERYDVNHPTFEFVRKYGTHFISSYATGAMLYQVFVYHKQYFYNMNENQKIKGIGNVDESQKKYFSPKYAIEVGRIVSADANSTIEEWAEKVTRQSEPNQPLFHNLLKLHDNLSVLKEFKTLAQNNVLIKLRMSSLINLIKNLDLRASLFRAVQLLYQN